MPNVVPIAFLVLAVVACGLGLIYLVRIFRQKKQALRHDGRDQRQGSLQSAREALTGLFSGSLSKLRASFWKFLAPAVIVLVISLLGLIAFAVIKNAI